MVLMRRKDKRRGNAEDELAVASDSSIIANKGVRSLQGARTGKFAADQRVRIGGYGRADKTWGVDHPWHQTREDMFKDLSSRDRMEEGYLAQEEEPKVAQGLSRAALKKKKTKMKKGGVADSSTADSEVGSESVQKVAAQMMEKEDAAVAPTSAQPKKAKKEKKLLSDATKEPALSSEDAKPKQTQEAQQQDGEGKSKKRKRVNRNKKKQQQQKQSHLGDISDDDSDAASAVSDAKEPFAPTKSKSAEKKAAEKKAADKKAAKKAESPAQRALEMEQKKVEIKAREEVAKQYESAAGHEFTTASGLIVRDVRIGEGRVPEVGEMLTVRYRGRLGDNNGLVFGKGMLSTSYGTGSVIAGWEEGMGTMRTGGIRHLVVPPALGYGSESKGGKIPANSTLYFEVELVRMGKRQRDVVAKDEVPLPSSFQRKRVKQTPIAAKTEAKSKRRRRKYSI